MRENPYHQQIDEPLFDAWNEGYTAGIFSDEVDALFVGTMALIVRFLNPGFSEEQVQGEVERIADGIVGVSDGDDES